MIKQIITEQHITTHKQLDDYLSKLSGDRYYYSYPLDVKNELDRVGLLEHCIIIELEGVKRFYEDKEL